MGAIKGQREARARRQTTPSHSVVGMLGVAALLAGALVVVFAPPAAAADANSDATFRTAFADGNVAAINLTGDIQMDCTSSAFTRGSANDLVVNGNGHSITGCDNKRVMQVTLGGGLLTLDHVVITGGDFTAAGAAIGGGAVSTGGNATVNSSTFVGNHLTSTQAGSVSATGGALEVFGSLTVNNSTFTDNHVTCSACTNPSTTAGGAIAAFGNATIRNSTLTLNGVDGGTFQVGGGIWSFPNLQLVYSTVVDNSAGFSANAHTVSGLLTSFGSVVALPNGGGDSCGLTEGATTTTNGYNFDDGSSCGFTGGVNGDVEDGGDPGLGALADNGGPTETRVPEVDSALMDAIPVGDCSDDGASVIVPLVDQRGGARPQHLGCDIGAGEFSGGSFHAVTPERIVDTRVGLGAPVGPVGPGATLDIDVLASEVPANGVDAVVLNVTATGATKAGWLTLFPAGTSLPTASNLNFVAGQTVPNLVVVKVGDGGNERRVNIANTDHPTIPTPNAGSVHVIADVMGWYDDGSVLPDALFSGVTPNRILDTRKDLGLTNAFTPGQERNLTVTGGGVPSDADAVVLNVTATAGTKAGWLTLYPTGASLPTASNLNFTAGQTVPNLVTVKIGTAGQVRFANTKHPTVPTPNAGSVHVIADVVGYYKTGVGDNLVAISPERIADTRNNTGGVGTAPLDPQEITAINAAIAANVPDFPGYSAVVVNITATGATHAGWFTAFPADATLPTASNVNFLAGQTVPNLAKLKVATTGDVGELNVANTAIPTNPQPSAGTVHLIVDIVAYFA